MNYEDFEKALETLHIVSKATAIDVKNKYQILSKQYHPDMPDGSDEKFREINEAYKAIQIYMKTFRFKLNKEEFYEQNPFSSQPDEWFKSFNC